MTASTAISRVYPKRKRAEVTYYDSFSDVDDLDTEYGESEIEEAPPPPTKKSKATKASNSTRPLPKKKIFPFFSLPAELRDEIYRHALTDVEELFLIARTRQYRRIAQIAAPIEAREVRRRHRFWSPSPDKIANSESTWVPKLVPNLLAVSRRVHDEAQPILYGRNVFALDDTAALHAFIAGIGPKNCATLKELQITGWGFSRAHKAINHPAFTILGQAINLKRLYINCQIHWGSPNEVARQIYRDGHHWFHTIGTAKGQVDAAVDILDIGDQNLGARYQWTDNVREWVKSPEEEQKRKQFQAELRKMLKAC